MKHKPQVIFSGVTKHTKGVGFKITFEDTETAVKYKDMMIWILKNDNIKVINKKGIYDVL